MLRILSPLDMVQRVDVKVDDGVLASGFIGSWVDLYQAVGGTTTTTTRHARFADSGYDRVYVIWSEGNKRGATMGSAPSAGFSPDTSQTKRLTTLVGKWRGWTNQISTGTGTTPGTLLCPDPSSTQGELMECVAMNISGLNAGAGTAAPFAGLTLNVYSGLPCAVVRDYVATYVHMGVTYTGVWEIESLG